MLGGKGGVTEGPLKMPLQYAAYPASTVAPHNPTITNPPPFPAARPHLTGHGFPPEFGKIIRRQLETA